MHIYPIPQEGYRIYTVLEEDKGQLIVDPIFPTSNIEIYEYSVSNLKYSKLHVIGYKLLYTDIYQQPFDL